MQPAPKKDTDPGVETTPTPIQADEPNTPFDGDPPPPPPDPDPGH